MFTVLECVAVQHDHAIVLLAAVICLLGMHAFFHLLLRAEESPAGRKPYWVLVAAFAAGLSVWATHFVAMLAYKGSVPIGFDFQFTGAVGGSGRSGVLAGAQGALAGELQSRYRRNAGYPFGCRHAFRRHGGHGCGRHDQLSLGPRFWWLCCCLGIFSAGLFPVPSFRRMETHRHSGRMFDLGNLRFAFHRHVGHDPVAGSVRCWPGSRQSRQSDHDCCRFGRDFPGPRSHCHRRSR
ncbi:membrane hypothetical protein [Agrobacterium fabacearum CFBP 5771]|nr:membrane hypothetical protein [Agrobacterium fabacearum CFBP 5771]